MKRKLANFDDPKWTYNDLKEYARKYRKSLKEKKDVPTNISQALILYQAQTYRRLVENLKKVQTYLYK